MRKAIIGIIVTVMICAAGLFAGFKGVDQASENDKSPVVTFPAGDVPIA